MKHPCSIILLALLLPMPSPAQIARSTNQSIITDEPAAVAIVEAINRHELLLADSLIGIKLRSDPSSLQWEFLRGMRYYADLFVDITVDNEVMSRMKESLESVVERGKKRLDEDENDQVALFYAGGAYGYLGIAYANDGSLFAGVGAAKSGYKMQERLIEMYPECYDAYLGPGLMNLLTCAIPAFLKPILYLFGLSGTEDKAFQYLSTAYTKGTLVTLEAGTYLAQLHARRKEFEEASQIYSSLISKYPMRVALCAESVSPMWSQKRYSDIVALSEGTMKLYESGTYSMTRGDSSWMPSIFINCAFAHEYLGDTVSAVNVLESFVSNQAYHNVRPWRIHLELGNLYLAGKDTLHATSHYRELLASDAPKKTKGRIQDLLDELGQSKD